MEVEVPDIETAGQALDNRPDPTELGDFPRGAKVVMAAEYEQELVESGVLGVIAGPGDPPTIVYMNRVGGVFSPGQNNAGTNRSTLAPQTVNFPAANLSENQWSEVMTCVTEQFSRFNIEVTDVDPGQVPHYESVVAGSPGLLGMPAGVGGVSPFTSNCDLIPNSIIFTFADVLPQNPQILCEVAAQEIAHSFGLDHEFLCEDPMTYLSGCGAKSFQDVLAPCGEGQARTCAQPGQYDCGYTQQNSVALMTQRIGLKQSANAEVSITAPIDGATVNLGFEVHADANSADTVELRIDGASVETLSLGPFLFATPTDLSAGNHVVEIVAMSAGNTSTDSITVTLVDDGSGGGGGGGGGNGGGGAGGAEGTPQVVGGCSTGGGSHSAAVFLLGLALLAIRRRRAL